MSYMISGLVPEGCNTPQLPVIYVTVSVTDVTFDIVIISGLPYTANMTTYWSESILRVF